MGISFFDLAVFIPLLVRSEQVIYYIFYGVTSVLTIFSTLYSTLVDPTDSMVLLQRKHKLVSQSQFDYQQHQLELYCDFCQAYVQTSSKHCKRCDRCAESFDHHCKWINNCVGANNYLTFFGMIVSVCLQFIISIVLHSQILYMYKNDTINHTSVMLKHNLEVKFIICIVLLVPCACAVVGLIQLILFHIYLMSKGITTYAYILEERGTEGKGKVVPYPSTIEIQNHVPNPEPSERLEFALPNSADEQQAEPPALYSFENLVQQEKKGNSSQGQLTNFDIEKTPQKVNRSDPMSEDHEEEESPQFNCQSRQATSKLEVNSVPTIFSRKEGHSLNEGGRQRRVD